MPCENVISIIRTKVTMSWVKLIVNKSHGKERLNSKDKAHTPLEEKVLNVKKLVVCKNAPTQLQEKDYL